MHMNQRRGFKSNLKAQDAEEKEQGKVKGAIAQLEREIRDAGHRTLGEHLAAKLGHGGPVRGLYTRRGMYKEEFESLWIKQAQANPEIWTERLKEKIERIIFFQRPLKPQDHLIGKCELEPGKKRCPRAS